MNFTAFYSDCMSRTNEVADEIEKYGGDAGQLIHESAYRMAVETYFATAFEIVDAMRGDGNLFDHAEHAASDELYGLQSNFSDWIHSVAYHGCYSVMCEQAERRGLEL